ncbi:MAG: ADP-ribosylglycohydrolase family protein, partial [Candidatus Cloacimonadaceae bacterium]|nr:ADP-ribosylglycohydrolase family protein [Candidatus Cloacimonadaceae bacterium]
TSEIMQILACPKSEYRALNRLLEVDIANLAEAEIDSGGYVVASLEASIWCLLTTETFPEAVLKAVNLGDDTDTTGAITGGLAALIYGYEAIPEEWIARLKKPELIQRIGSGWGSEGV